MQKREGMVNSLVWNSGGYGFGIMPVAASMIWEMDVPGPDKPDLQSIVAVSGPQEKYTDEELAQIVEFARKATEQYDKMFKYRRGANLILFDKVRKDMWLRKRLTWTVGTMYSNSLDEAISFMEKSVLH